MPACGKVLFGQGRPEVGDKSVAGLTVEQYASYCVELALYPDQKSKIRARYHITGEGEHAKVNLKWNNAIAASPGTRTRFQEVFAAYRAHLRNHPLKW